MDSVADKQFDWTLDPKTLREEYKQTNFDVQFQRQIVSDVISVLSPQLVQEPHNLVYDDDLVYERLIGPLERFICNLSSDASQEEVDERLDQLRTLKQPSKVCRKVLKTGDVLFSCNDCGLDETCVVCIDCFHKSAHKDHNYRMSNTDGGGCCDCGDHEAWRQNPACSDHQANDQPNLKLADYEDIEKRKKQIESDRQGILEKISLLPEGYASRYFRICQASLHYARTMLTWEDFHSLPPSLEVPEPDETLKGLLSKEPSSKNYFTVLFNDEVHTYDHVITTLVRIIKCTKMTASIMASSVSREGRSLILQDTYRPCKQVSDSIACIRDSNQGPLKVEVMHGSILAHQAYALKLIEWIKRMSLICDAFRVLTAYTLLGSFDHIAEQEEPAADMSLLEKVMRSNTSYWKMARIDWNDLFVATLLTEYSIKDKFARLITRSYPDLVQDFINDDHDHSVSILTMTTQLYTVPSLICMLIEEENALQIIAQKLIFVCRSAKREITSMTFDSRNTYDMHGLKRGFYVIPDIKHLINIEPTKWTDRLRGNVIDAVTIFLDLLESMQNMDSVKRQLGQHLEYEQEWETGMTLQSRLITLISRLVTYCSLDETVLRETLRDAQRRLVTKFNNFKTIKREIAGIEATCIHYEVSLSPVSVHLPLTRFAAALIVELMRKLPPNYPDLKALESQIILAGSMNGMIDIMEPSLRTAVMIAQYRSGMWRRNGFSLVNQINYFSGALMRKEMYDRDVLVLQECAAVCDADRFLIHLINKFNLIIWVNSETTREPLVGPKAYSFLNDEENMTQTMSLGEEFLQVLLTVISERYRVGIGRVTSEDVIKNEIIQLLCIGPFTRSDITQKLFYNDHEIDCIKSVADLRRSGELSTGKYELKSEFYERFNPFFYHYNRRHQSHALDAQLKRKRNAKESLLCCPPPKPVELTAQFKNLNNLIICKITLTIIQKILRRAVGPPDPKNECSTKAPICFQASDLQLDQCLHLVGLGLHEQERDKLNFDYMQAAHEMQIWELLKDCYETAKRSRDLIFWLMQKASAIYEKNSSIIKSNRDVIEECFKTVLGASDASKQDSKKRSSELAAQRRERIMAMMRAKQDKFLSNPATRELAAETAKHEAPRQASLAAAAAAASAATATATTTTTAPPASSQQQQQQQSSIYLPPANDPAQMAPPTLNDAAQQASMDYELLTNEEGSSLPPGASCRMETDNESVNMADTAESQSNSASDDHLQQPPPTPESSIHLCILCRDEQYVAFDKPTMVLLAYIQRSAVLSKNRIERRIPNYSLTPSNQLKYLSKSDKYSYTSDNGRSFDATHMPSDLFFGPYISTCGHAMHYDCWRGFSDAITKRETTRPNRGSRHTSFELDKNEILCPLCECISNATIPLIPDYIRPAQRNSTTSGGATKGVDSVAANRLTAFLHALKGTVATFQHVRHLNTSNSGQPSSAVAATAAGSSYSSSSSSSTPCASASLSHEDKYVRLLQPTTINDVLKELAEQEALVLRDFIATIRKNSIQATICTKPLLRSIQTLAERIHSVGLDLDRSVRDVHHARIFMMTSWSISYTIQAHERAARFKGSALFADRESSKNLCLSSLVRFACTSMMTHQSDMIQSLLVEKLRYLLISDEHQMASPCVLDIDALELYVSLFVMLQKLYSHFSDDDKHQQQQQQLHHQAPMQSDPLDLNISSASATSSPSDSSISTSVTDSSAEISPDNSSNSLLSHHNKPCAYPTMSASYAWTTSAYDHEYFNDLLHLMVLLNLIQVIISLQTDDNFVDVDAHASDDQANCDLEPLMLHNFYRDIITASGHPKSRLYGPSRRFVKRVKSALLPFLRSCAIFIYQLSHREPSERLQTKSAFCEGSDFVSHQDKSQTAESQTQHHEEEEEAARPFDVDESEAMDEFEALCEYLSLPSDLSHLLGSREARSLALSWLRHSRVLLLIKAAIAEADKMKAQREEHHAKMTSSSLKRVGSSSTGLAQQQQQLKQQEQQTSDTKNELMPVKLIRQPHSVNRLIDLPYDYSELVDKVSNFTCPSIKNEDSRTPTMCLVCGVMLCSQSYCCQRDLNDLASNYMKIIKRQERKYQHWLDSNAAHLSGRADQDRSHAATSGTGSGLVQGSAAATAVSIHSGAMQAISLLLGTRDAGGAPQPAPATAATRAARLADGSLHLGHLNPAEVTSLFTHPHISQQLVGSCTYHAHECSGGVGIFLRIRSCQILLLSGRSKGCYMPAPYIDDHGETDFGLARGNPLHLNRLHYQRLQHLWMNHSIPEQISRTLEYSSYASSINWHLH